MDPLSDALALLKPRNYMFHGLDAGGDWSIYFEPRQGIRCYALLSGQFWLTLGNSPEAVHFKEGDCVLLPSGHGVTLSSDPTLPTVDAKIIFSEVKEGGLVTYKGGGNCYGLGGFFEFSGRHASILLGILPTIIHIRKESDKNVLRRSLEQIMQELREPQPGGTLIAQYLSSLMLVQALRLFLFERAEVTNATGSTDVGVGWIYALADKQVGTAICAMHENPAHRWTIQSLASRSYMSRSTFAMKFKNLVGESPMNYLTRWRMLLAGDRLLNSHDTIAVIAPSLGYKSESSFSTAFKRVMQCSPREYRALFQ
ncbi:AraC family transcriptional regulator [Undibacterium sp. TS12]|uniref:AraC family transcriptional regulator n=1 Tax=Undibacterium sp. TS12 TaxID=2908202 RepID=UPI001F4CDB83|nr:AraC family transcriptional regulator [Undibacterium sp. TS12]MCH8622462.1 AraC family transcriptional regulator [Undibacterium sp. TS12]